jgi:hypothetical protein
MHLTDKKNWLRVKEWKNIFQANGHQKQAGVVIHISDNRLQTKIIQKRQKGHFILMKRIIH